MGQLVTKKLLLKGYKVCVVARDQDKARGLLLDDDDSDGVKSSLEVAQLNLVGDGKASDEELQRAMKGVLVLFLSRFTNMFPNLLTYGQIHLVLTFRRCSTN